MVMYCILWDDGTLEENLKLKSHVEACLFTIRLQDYCILEDGFIICGTRTTTSGTLPLSRKFNKSANTYSDK